MPQTPTRVGEQQCPHGALICLIGYLWGLGSLAGREEESCHPHQGQTSHCKVSFLRAGGLGGGAGNGAAWPGPNQGP